MQRQYLAQLMVNEGSLPNNNHPSWEKTDAYLTENGENSLPKRTIDGIFFDINLTVKEFFKEIYSCMFYGFRQLGLILFIPLFFLIKDVLKTKRLNVSLMIPICLLVMISVFSLIIISFMELRWLAPVFILTIVYFSDLQKEKTYLARLNKEHIEAQEIAQNALLEYNSKKQSYDIKISDIREKQVTNDKLLQAGKKNESIH